MNRLSDIARGIAAILMLAVMGMIVLTFMPSQTSNSVASAMTARDNTQANKPAEKATAYPAPATPIAATVRPSPYPNPARFTPTPLPPTATKRPTFSSYFSPEQRQVTSLLTYRPDKELPDYRIISDNQQEKEKLSVKPMSLTFKGQLPDKKPLGLKNEERHLAGGFVDNWQLLAEAGFEKNGPAFPPSGCSLEDHVFDGYQRLWGRDETRSFEGEEAGWPARGGRDGVDPSQGYPPNLSSWLICGPFDLSQADKFMVEFALWVESYDEKDDYLFFGTSTDAKGDPNTFQGERWTFENEWVLERQHIEGVAGQSNVWVAWAFESDGDDQRAAGAWIDNLSIWAYRTPDKVCGGPEKYPMDQRGVAVPPYDPEVGGVAPIIRHDDTDVLDALIRLKASWARLGFHQRQGSVNVRDYDRMVDSLCAATDEGIRVLGLINHETLVRQDFNAQGNAKEYAEEFAKQAAFLADHFKDRITYWEIWNEEDYDPNPEDPFNAPRIDPIRYAPLLTASYKAIKSANPKAQVIFGGLASAWDRPLDYLRQVYEELGSERPFDYFAVHPYPDLIHGINPVEYMLSDPGHNTILDKFLQLMDDRNDGNKKIWITEVGWNSAKDTKNAPSCPSQRDILVYEAEQADYLFSGFKILLTEVHHWQTYMDAVEKVIWYQYMDIGIPEGAVCPETPVAGNMAWKGYVPAGAEAYNKLKGPPVNWWFGLYRADKESSKPVSCAFVAYPNQCQNIFLPLIERPIPKR